MRAVQDVPLHANVLESGLLQQLVESVRGGRPPSGGRGRAVGFSFSSSAPATSQFTGPISAVLQRFFSGGNYWPSAMPNFSRLNIRVSNHLVACDTRVGMSFGSYGGSQLPFGFSSESSFAPGPNIATDVTRSNMCNLSTRLLMCDRLSGPNQHLGGTYSSLRPRGNSFPNGPHSNYVEFVPFLGLGRELGTSGDSVYNASRPSVNWRTNQGLRCTLGLIHALGFLVYLIYIRLVYPTLLGLIFIPVSLGLTLMGLILISLCPSELHPEEELHFDLPIINKYTDGLQDEYKIPDNCWTKGLMVQTEDGHWMFKDSLSQILQVFKWTNLMLSSKICIPV
ncbi:hypothetical protein Gotur_020563 [Gossypium turneri]